MDFRTAFDEQIRIALYGAGVNRLKVANVEFWLETGELCFDIPTSQWKRGVLAAELVPLVENGFKRARVLAEYLNSK